MAKIEPNGNGWVANSLPESNTCCKETVVNAKIIRLHRAISSATESETLPFHSKVAVCENGRYQKLCEFARKFPGFHLEKEAETSTEEFVQSLMKYIIDNSEMKREECLSELHQIREIIEGETLSNRPVSKLFGKLF